MNLKELLKYGKESLKNHNIDDFEIISKILAEHIIDFDKSTFIIHFEDELQDESVEQYKLAINRVVNGLPVQYITNKQEFMKLNFYVDENVLIPQPDTELLVQEVINFYDDKNCKILDLCTGSGAIGISIAKYIKNSKVVASDISNKAIQIAKLNAEKNLVHTKMDFVCSDMFKNINKEKFDVIVSNPPYIETELIKTLDSQVKNEPTIALDGGDDGLKFYKIIAEDAYNYLNDNGTLFLEIGYNQKDSVIKILEETGYYKNIYSKKDFGGNDRIVVCNKLNIKEEINVFLKQEKYREAIMFLKEKYSKLFKKMLDFKSKSYEDYFEDFSSLLSLIPSVYPQYSDTILVLGNALTCADDTYLDVIDIMVNAYEKMSNGYKEESYYSEDMWDFDDE